MILEQHYLTCLAQASYLIVDEASGVAAVVDPRRDVDLYIDRAAALGARIEHVLLTHFHADFLAGHVELARRTGARLALGRAGSASFEHTPLAEGDEIVLGPVEESRVSLRVLETPGHTPESVCYLVFDADESREQPHAVLTGDTLFIGDVGRPDLMGSVGITAADLAARMYHSLRDKLLALPDETLLYPGHGAGSACGKNLSSETSCTIGRQRVSNYALQEMSEQEFVRMLVAGQPVAPAYFPRAAVMNKSDHEPLQETLSRGLVGLSFDELLARREAGAQVLDTRCKDEFAAGHLSGSLNVGLDGMFASWAGSVLDLDRPVVLVTPPGKEQESVLRLGRVGIDLVTGYLEGGAASLAGRPEHVVDSPRLSVDAAARALAGEEPPLVLDVRQPGEVESERIAGSISIPLGQLSSREGELDRDAPMLVHCKTGYRSMTAMSLLQSLGFTRLLDLDGGMEAWLEAGQGVERPTEVTG